MHLLIFHHSFWCLYMLFNQANRSQCFLFKLPWLFDCWCGVHFNFHLLYIFKFVFSLGGGNFPFVLEVDLCLLFCSLGFIFFSGGDLLFHFLLSFFLFFFLLSLFWSFMKSVLIWVVVSSGSSISIRLNLLIMGLVHLLVFSFGFFLSLLRGFFLILVVSHVHLGLLKRVP